MNLTGQLKQIGSFGQTLYKYREDITQLKKEYPELNDFIDEIKDKINVKFLRWAVIRRKKENASLRYLVRLSRRFDKYTFRGISKAARLGLIRSEEQGNISYWYNKAVKNFEFFLDRLDGYNIDLALLRRKPFKHKTYRDSELVYRDGRVVIWRPMSADALDDIKQDNDWVASDKKEYRKRSIKGEVFIFIFDKLANPDSVPESKGVLIYDILGKKIVGVWDRTGFQMGTDRVADHYGRHYWLKIKKTILSYLGRRGILIRRQKGEWWYGDKVGYDDDFIYGSAFGMNFPATWEPFHRFLVRFYNSFVGIITDPLVVMPWYSEKHGTSIPETVEVTWTIPDMIDELNAEARRLRRVGHNVEPDELEDIKYDIIDFMDKGKFVNREFTNNLLMISKNKDLASAIQKFR